MGYGVTVHVPNPYETKGDLYGPLPVNFNDPALQEARRVAFEQRIQLDMGIHARIKAGTLPGAAQPHPFTYGQIPVIRDIVQDWLREDVDAGTPIDEAKTAALGMYRVLGWAQQAYEFPAGESI